MNSESWESIKHVYESLPSSLQPKNANRAEGFQHMVSLIPYLQKNEVIDSCTRFLSHYSLVLMVDTKGSKVHVIPPGFISSGSDSEFCVSLLNNKEHKIVEQRFSVLRFTDVVNTTEKYLLQIQQM